MALQKGIEITPFDSWRVGPGADCVYIAEALVHRVELSFDAPGEYLIAIRGRPDALAEPEELISVEQVVNIQE